MTSYKSVIIGLPTTMYTFFLVQILGRIDEAMHKFPVLGVDAIVEFTVKNRAC